MKTELYDVLGVPPDADEKAIRSGFRKAAKRSHPDAGGSPEEFAKLTRALAILTNPTTRDRYDRTGQAEPAGPDNEQSEIAAMVMQAVLFAVSNTPDLRFADIVRVGIDHIGGKIREVDGQIAQHKAGANDAISKLETVQKRLKRKKAKGPDVLAAMIDGTMAGARRTLEENLEKLEPMLRKLKAAREVLAGYSYERDQRDPQTQGAMQAGLQDFMRQQTSQSFFGR
jgi:curved DNA-binding protein CbpA